MLIMTYFIGVPQNIWYFIFRTVFGKHKFGKVEFY